MNIKDFIFSSKVLPPKGDGTSSDPNIKPLTIKENGMYRATGNVDGYSPITVDIEIPEATEPTIEPLTITENGTYNAPDGVDGYSPITVEVESEGSAVNPNWTDWSYLFYNGARSESIEKLKFTDSHNVVNFSYTFNGCSNLTSIPELDTSNGIDFSYMFNRCSKLTSIPKLNLSKGTTFSGIFGYCYALVEIGFEGTFNVSANNTSFLPSASNVNQESLHKLIDIMVKTGTASTYTIGIGSSNLARVSEEYINKALEKGIVLQ